MGDKYPVLRAKTSRFDGHLKCLTFDEAELDRVANDSLNGYILIEDTDGEMISIPPVEAVLSFKHAEVAFEPLSSAQQTIWIRPTESETAKPALWRSF